MSTGSKSAPALPGAGKKIRLTCPCGDTLVAYSEDELVDKANEHLEQEHPHMAGGYTRDQILFMAF